MLRKCIFFLAMMCSGVSFSYASDDLISVFPLANYDQTIATWLKPSNPDFDKPILSSDMQKKRLDIYIEHYFGSVSPWDANYITQILRQPAPNNLRTIEQSLIDNFSNAGKAGDKIGYGENFKPYAQGWIDSIANNINVARLDSLTYQSANRGIAVDNLHARALPTEDVHFYSYKLAGQGYPFDNLQVSVLWAGTPVYILTETQDHTWMLVVSPDYIGWVKSNGIARASSEFISTWTSAAKQKLAAITRTPTSLLDQDGNYLVTAYIGSVFPAHSKGSTEIWVPVADQNHHAVAKVAKVPPGSIAAMPMTATPHNFSNLMSTLIGRPYGWGGMYFYNDCSAELKSLFTPFGVWLPRHSSDQVTVGKMVDMSTAPKEQRLSYLLENGKNLLTIIYIGGHVILYVGNYPGKESELMAMTYQNIWGLSPNPPVRRAVIGQAVLFPMLLSYPEDRSLVSLADKKYFQVAFLSELPTVTYQLQRGIDLKSLMYPEEI